MRISHKFSLPRPHYLPHICLHGYARVIANRTQESELVSLGVLRAFFICGRVLLANFFILKLFYKKCFYAGHCDAIVVSSFPSPPPLNLCSYNRPRRPPRLPPLLSPYIRENLALHGFGVTSQISCDCAFKCIGRTFFQAPPLCTNVQISAYCSNIGA